MSKQTVNVGTNPNDNTGDSLRLSFQKTNSNIDEIYADDFVTSARIADNVALGGNPTTTTQSAGDNSTKVSTTAYADAAVAAAIDAAPAALDTLNELAASLNDDADFAGSMTTSLAGKLATTAGAVGTANLAADAVNGDKIADDSINSEHYAAGSIDTDHIADSQITTGKIANDAVTADKIADSINSAIAANTAKLTNATHTGDVTGSGALTIGNDKVITAKILDANVTTAKIADANITVAKMAANSVDSDQYVDGSIDADHIAANAVITAKILDANITAGKIAGDAVNGDKIADNSIDSEHYVDGSIDTAHISADAVNGDKIADDSIGAEHIADNAVGSAAINDDVAGNGLSISNGVLSVDAIAAAGIAADAVITAKILNANVTTAKIANNAIDADKLADNAVAAAGIAADAVITAKILNANVTTAKIADNAVTLDKIADAVFVTQAEGIAGNDNDTTLPTSAAVKDYVDNVTDNDTLAALNNGDGNFVVGNGSAFVVESGATARDSVGLGTSGHIQFHCLGIGQSASTVGGQIDASTVYAATFGLNADDKIVFTDNTKIDFTVNGNNEMRLEADGDLHVDGDVIAASTTVASDKKLKENIETISGAGDIIDQIKGVDFTWKKDGKKSSGVIAQDIEKVMPHLVKEVSSLDSDDTHLTVDYNGLIGVLIQAVKELKAEVETLKTK